MPRDGFDRLAARCNPFLLFMQTSDAGKTPCRNDLEEPCNQSGLDASNMQIVRNVCDASAEDVDEVT